MFSLFSNKKLDNNTLIRILNNHEELVSLDLRNSDTNDDDVQNLVDALQYNNTLTKLQLDYSFIGDRGTRLLAEMLEDNRSLTLLGIGWQRGDCCGNLGLKAMAKALKINDTLKSIHLCYNPISDDLSGLLALVEAVEEKNCLDHYCVLIPKKMYDEMPKTRKQMIKQIMQKIGRYNESHAKKDSAEKQSTSSNQIVSTATESLKNYDLQSFFPRPSEVTTVTKETEELVKLVTSRQTGKK